MNETSAHYQNRLRRRDFFYSISLLAASPALMQARGLEGLLFEDDVLGRRRAYLEQLRRILPHTRWPIGRINAVDQMWENWLERTGELPPDFQNLPAVAELPNLLIGVDGNRTTPIRSVAQWEAKRQWMKEQIQHWIVGRFPPAPTNLTATVTDSWLEGDVRVQDVLLRFGPGQSATLKIQVQIPPGDGPFPALVTTHSRRRPWVNTAVRRGYIGCVSDGAETIYVESDNSDPWLDIYPDYDFGAIGRWAWGLMRAVDYLYTLPVVDKERIATSGHSRNAKLSLIAAAFDERFGAVIPSRGNTGTEISFRHANETFHNESLEELTRYFAHWFHPRLRFFVGREHQLPIDVNALTALVAPRGLLLSHAHSEHQGNPWGAEQTFRSIEPVWAFLGAEENLGIYQKPGSHASSPEDFEVYLDFTDSVFGRDKHPRPEIFICDYSYENWKALTGFSVDPAQFREKQPGGRFLDTFPPISTSRQWAAHREKIRSDLSWFLGDEPPGISFPSRERLGGRAWENDRTSSGYLGRFTVRPNRTAEMGRSGFSYGDDLSGQLYYPQVLVEGREPGDPPRRRSAVREGSSLPLAIWLHPYGYATGFGQFLDWSFSRLVRSGFAVAAMDQIGFGTRIEQLGGFYRRYPSWSLLGRMVADVRAVIDKLSPVAGIDSNRVVLFGFALGAKVGLLTAAVDERVRAVAAISGFSPLRLTAGRKDIEGIRHYSHLHGLAPRLGSFVEHPSRLPIDYDEILALIAPRPVLILAPTLDRFYPVEDVLKGVSAARHIYRLLGAEAALQVETPEGFAGFSLQRPWQQQTLEWMADQCGLEAWRERRRSRRTPEEPDGNGSD